MVGVLLSVAVYPECTLEAGNYGSEAVVFCCLFVLYYEALGFEWVCDGFSADAADVSGLSHWSGPRCKHFYTGDSSYGKSI